MAASRTASREREPRLLDVTRATFDSLPCCGIKSAAHPGRREKCTWLEANAQYGLRGKELIAPDGRPCGYIEYTPGEHAWRGVDARGYMFIHCVWVHPRKYMGKGWGRHLVEACIDDARKSGMNGVAVMVREGPWMADARVFRGLGFEQVDAAPPDYEMLAVKFKPGAANPTFRRDVEKNAAKYGRGLTIIRSSQCPYIAKFSAEIAETAEQEYGIKPKIVDLRTAAEAQSAPTPYATFSILYDGKAVADHQISRTRFRNIMRKLREWPPRAVPLVHKLPR